MKTIGKILALFAIASLFFACQPVANSAVTGSGIAEKVSERSPVAVETDENGNIGVHFDIAENGGARTVLPETLPDKTLFTDFVLYSKESGSSDNYRVLGSWADYDALQSAVVYIAPVTYDFKLCAKYKNAFFRGELFCCTISENENNLSFTLNLVNVENDQAEKGSLELSINPNSNTTGIQLITVSLYSLDDNSLTDILTGNATECDSASKENPTGVYTYSRSELDGGNYYILVDVYADLDKKIPMGSYAESILICDDQNSAKELVFDNNKLNPVYSVDFVMNGGSDSNGTSIRYTRFSDAFVLPVETLSKRGYTFEGWYTSSSFTSGSAITEIPANSAEQYTVYAKWTANTYNITYNLNGGSNPANAPATHTYDKATTLPTPTRTGYTFAGWYTTSDFSGSGFTSLSAIGYTADITLYAKWTANVYNIRYYLNSGTNPASAPKTHTYGTSTTLPTPTRKGYTFAGWYTTSYFGTPILTSLSATAYTADITLYAKWIANIYTITYSLNSGTNPTSAPKTHTYGTSTTLPTPTRTGYTFAGWYATSDFSSSKLTTLSATGYTADITLYAKWTVKTYNIYYTLNGGTKGDNTPTTHTYDTATSLVAPTRTGYIFKGWYTSSSYTGNPVTEIGKTDITSSIYLYAKWEGEKHTITFVTNGGSAVQPITFQNGTSIVFPEPTKDGVDFYYWRRVYSENSYNSYWPSSMYSFVLTEDITLYARWKATITYVTGRSDIKDTTYYCDVTDGATKIRLAYLHNDSVKVSGWYTDAACTNLFGSTKYKVNINFSDDIMLDSNLTLYAKWSDSVPPAAPTDFTMTLSDDAKYLIFTWTNPSDADLSYTELVRHYPDPDPEVSTTWYSWLQNVTVSGNKSTYKFAISSLSVGVENEFYCEAVDKDGNATPCSTKYTYTRTQ